LSLELLPLDVRDKERGYEILDEDFGLVSSLFNFINEFVESISL
jgi:hypothetical protein